MAEDAFYELVPKAEFLAFLQLCPPMAQEVQILSTQSDVCGETKVPYRPFAIRLVRSLIEFVLLAKQRATPTNPLVIVLPETPSISGRDSLSRIRFSLQTLDFAHALAKGLRIPVEVIWAFCDEAFLFTNCPGGMNRYREASLRTQALFHDIMTRLSRPGMREIHFSNYCQNAEYQHAYNGLLQALRRTPELLDSLLKTLPVTYWTTSPANHDPAFDTVPLPEGIRDIPKRGAPSNSVKVSEESIRHHGGYLNYSTQEAALILSLARPKGMLVKASYPGEAVFEEPIAVGNPILYPDEDRPAIGIAVFEAGFAVAEDPQQPNEPKRLVPYQTPSVKVRSEVEVVLVGDSAPIIEDKLSSALRFFVGPPPRPAFLSPIIEAEYVSASLEGLSRGDVDERISSIIMRIRTSDASDMVSGLAQKVATELPPLTPMIAGTEFPFETLSEYLDRLSGGLAIRANPRCPLCVSPNVEVPA